MGCLKSASGVRRRKSLTIEVFRGKETRETCEF